MNSIGDTARMRPRGVGLGRSLLQPDRRLARRAAAGEMDAFEAIFERHHQDLYRYCLSILRDPDDAQDALQNTIAAAMRSLPGERRQIELRPWLFRVAHNSAISIVRARRRHDELDLAERPDPVASDHLEARQRLRQLLVDLDSLSEQRRAALTMRELSGLSFKQIGSALQISAQAARQAVYEARVDLRELEGGRAMNCERVCELVSAGDRRALRGKAIRAHLRECERCQDFRNAIDRRSADLAVLAPPLPPLLAAGLLKGSLGAAAGGAGAGIGTGFGVSLTLKAAASVAAATAIGVGVADYSGLIDAPIVGDGRDSSPARSAPAPAPAAPVAPAGERPAPPGAPASVRGAAAPGRDRARAAAQPGGARGHANGEPRGAVPPAHANGNPPASPGAPTVPPAPAHSSAGGAGAPAHSSAGGQGAPEQANAGGLGPGAAAGAGASALDAAPAHASAGGSMTAAAQGGGRPDAPGTGAN
jgi:RNA polymerase sigma factor (sigma-70 family)